MTSLALEEQLPAVQTPWTAPADCSGSSLPEVFKTSLLYYYTDPGLLGLKRFAWSGKTFQHLPKELLSCITHSLPLSVHSLAQ